METDKLSRIREIMKIEDLSANALADKIGFNQSNLSKILRGERKVPETLLTLISDHFKVNRTWLADGVGEMRTADETRPHFPTEVAAGALVGMSDPVTLQDCEMRPVVRQFPSYDYTMVIRGDSMEPKFEGGDEIAIRRITDFVEWGKVYVLNTQDGAVIKRIYDAGDAYRCVSYNQAYPDFLVPKDSVISIFKVVGQLRY